MQDLDELVRRAIIINAAIDCETGLNLVTGEYSAAIKEDVELVMKLFARRKFYCDLIKTLVGIKRMKELVNADL